MTVHVLSRQPEVTIGEDGFRVLLRDLVVDLGVRFPVLEGWAFDHGRVPWIYYHVFSTAIRVPKGMRYDGASIPGIIQSLIMGPKENYEIAGCVHDALYRWQVPKELADEVFWLISRAGEKNVGPVQAWLGWAALRLFGGSAYESHHG